MSGHVELAVVLGALKRVLSEAFGGEHGIFLDRGTSLIDTLEIVSAAEASKPISLHGTSIAAHTYHVKFYLDELIHATHHGPREIEWEESWDLTQVSEPEWVKLRADLQASYAQIADIIGNIDEERINLYLPGAIGLIAHTAYHIGAIRQILNVVRV